MALLRNILFLSLLCGLSTAVVHGPKLDREITREPYIIEMDGPDQPLSDVYKKAQEKEERYKERSRRDIPDTTPDGFGTTAVLTGDRHTYGLVHWSGVPRQRIFILTRQRNSQGYSTESFLWLSTDYGKTFHNITSRFPSNAVMEWYYISSDPAKMIFSDRINQKIYVTTNEGDNFTTYNVQFRPDTFRFQYSRFPNVKSYSSYVLGYDTSANSLWVSKNMGSSWTQLGQTVTRYEWRQLNSTYEDGSVVYFDQTVNDTAAKLYKASAPNYTPVIFDASLGCFMPNSFALSYQYMFVQKNYTDIGSPLDGYVSPLWVSHYRKPFKSARFPLQIEEKHYAMVDSSEGQVLMGVFHDPNNTNLYISEEAGLNYSLSLEHIISPPESFWIDSYPRFDVYVVAGIPGTYLVNKRVYGSLEGATVISFDKGGQWDVLTPPTVDANGNPITCNLPCSLHLHMFVDELYGFSPIVSRASAPNLIMALGNLGISLERGNYSKLRLYISDNGGVSWRELASGYYYFQLVNFGVFTTIISKYQQTYYVSWSCDEGYHWKNYTITNNGSAEKIYVVQMFTEYGEESQHASVFGYHPLHSFSEFQWLVIDLDFTVLNLSNCSSNDYYQWSPTDEREGQQCILGESITYERRLPDHCCVINYDYDRPVSRVPCSCTYEDFECQVGFEHVGLSGLCTPMEDTIYPPPPPSDCSEGEHYQYSSMYRKIAGDKCVNGNETFYYDVSVECPVQAPADLKISVPQLSIAFGNPFTFTLSQNSGAKHVTYYKWYFGDGNTSATIQGFVQAYLISYTYNAPGVYNVTIVAYNNGGNNSQYITVTVQDKITDFQMSYSNPVALGHPVLFTVTNVTTWQNTQYYKPLTYQWVFPNNIDVSSSSPYAVHTFTENGLQSVLVLLSNTVGSKPKSFSINVETAPPQLKLTAVFGSSSTSSGFVPIGQPVTFGVSSLNTTNPIPEGVSFTWSIIFSANEEVLLNHITSDQTQKFTFQNLGKFIVTVTSKDVGGESTVVRVYNSEYYIHHVKFASFSNVYRMYSDVATHFSIDTNSSYLYNGNMFFRVWIPAPTDTGLTDQLLGSGLTTIKDGSGDFTWKLSGSAGTVVVDIELYNNVSSVTLFQQLTVARGNQMAYIRLFFKNSSLPSNYHSYKFKLSLQNTIFSNFLSRYNLKSWQLIVNVTEEVTTPEPPQGPVAVAKRSTDTTPLLYLVAHVTILPTSLNDSAIQLVQAYSQTLVTIANNGSLSFTVESNVLLVDAGDTGPTIIIIEPGTRSQDYKILAIGLGLGIFAFFLIAIAVIGIIFYYWRKKYRSLEVRYTRLRQGPMRFTFTADGETLEEEYDDDETDKQETPQQKDEEEEEDIEFTEFK